MKLKLLQIRLNTIFQLEDELIVNEFLSVHDILHVNTQLLNQKGFSWSLLIQYKEKNLDISEPAFENYNSEDPEVLNENEIKLLESLTLWRSEKAKTNSIPHYMIASNKELISLIKYRPSRKEEMTEIKGFGKYKIENFGTEIMGILAAS